MPGAGMRPASVYPGRQAPDSVSLRRVNRHQITRGDFPAGSDGYDRLSVDAHLAAVAAWTAALEAQITALQVERDALRRQSEETRQPQPDSPAASTEPEPPVAMPGGSQPIEPAESGTVEPEPTGPEPVPTGPEPSADSLERSDDEVSARLVATRLALEGAGREQIREKLDSAYELDDIDSLVDDVLERLG